MPRAAFQRHVPARVWCRSGFRLSGAIEALGVGPPGGAYLLVPSPTPCFLPHLYFVALRVCPAVPDPPVCYLLCDKVRCLFGAGAVTPMKTYNFEVHLLPRFLFKAPRGDISTPLGKVVISEEAQEGIKSKGNGKAPSGGAWTCPPHPHQHLSEKLLVLWKLGVGSPG